MNPNTGEVVHVPEDEKEREELFRRRPEVRSWTSFDIGETVIVKGIPLKVHEVGESRLVLKFEKRT
jgi:hypothetical protein